jgi:hypothetical protein
MAGGGWGGQQRRRWRGLTFHIIFIIKTEFWIVGVIGGGQRRNAISKNTQPGKLTYVGNWYYYIEQRKLLKPPNMAL